MNKTTRATIDRLKKNGLSGEALEQVTKALQGQLNPMNGGGDATYHLGDELVAVLGSPNEIEWRVTTSRQGDKTLIVTPVKGKK